MSNGIAIALSVLLLAANAFFVGAEFALVSSRRDRLETLREQGVSGAKTVIDASENASMMMAAAQLGITVCTIGLGSLGEPAVARTLENLLHPFDIPAAALHPIAFAIALIIVVVLHVLIGEMVPKNIAIAGPERTALFLVPALVAFLKVARPLIGFYNLLANIILRVIRVEPKDEFESAYTTGELAQMIAESRREGLLDDSEHRRISQALSSASRRVSDVLVASDSLMTVPAQPTVGDMERAVTETGYSRFPVRAEDGSLTGYLHIKDVLDQAASPATTPVPLSRIRRLPELLASSTLDEAITILRRKQSHLAKVIDETGAEVGVVALDDLVEEYVGTVRDSTHVARSR